MRNNAQAKQKPAAAHIVLTVIGAVLCVVLIPILIINCTLIFRSYTNPDQVPAVGGVVPLVVLSDSMYPQIKSGDLIVCHTVKPEEVTTGDVIAFFDPAGSGSSIVTHRVVEIVAEEDSLSFRTKGDANNVEDQALVPAENLVGRYSFGIVGLGNVAIFMSTTQGLLLCVVLPLVLLITYDLVRGRRQEKARLNDADALRAELEALRAEKSATQQNDTGNVT